MGFGRIVTDGERLRQRLDSYSVRYDKDGKAYSVRTGKPVQGSRYYAPLRESLADYKARMQKLCLIG